jgi:adenine phosphoribosyltransferase
MNIHHLIKSIVDFPKPGVIFYDINPLIYDNLGFQKVIDSFAKYYRNKSIDKVVGLEARGFIFGASLAYALKIGFVPIRKPNKLPPPVYRQAFQLEYGEDVLELQQQALNPGENVLVIDDVLATGGTIRASLGLLKQAKVNVVGCGIVLELTHLKARELKELRGLDIHALHVI